MKLERVIDLAETYGITRILDSLKIEYQVNGDWVKTRCMFHNGEKFNLTYRNKFFYCFSECNRSYSIVDVVKQQLGLTFFESVRWLCNQMGVSFESEMRKSDPKAEELLKTLRKANRLKHEKESSELKEIDPSIFNDIKKIGHRILKEEGFDNEIVEFFNLGVANGGYFDKRVTIPIDYIDGTIISMSGRLPDRYVDDYGNPKYKHLNNADKGKTLYNISRAMRASKEKGFIIVVEGFKSVWRLHQWGFNNAVATMGASLSDDQRNILLKLGCKIIVCGDNDEAGKHLNQQIYNKCSAFTQVKKLDISKITNKEKASIDEIEKPEFLILLGE